MFQIRRNDNKNHTIIEETCAKKERHFIKSERIQKLIPVLNRYSLLFHVLLACGVCFAIEWISRHSFLSACSFVIDRNLVFLYNSLIVFASLMLVYTVKRRALLRTVISVLWLFLGTINGCILAKRVSPFSFTDIKMVGDLFTMQSNYFSAGEATLVIAGVTAVVAFLVFLWFKGPKFQGRTHRLLGLLATVAVVMMIPSVTDAAVSNNILTSYFENLAQGYKDYGFVYSFSSSVLDRGMHTPDDYSEETVDAVLAKIGRTEQTGKTEVTAAVETPQTEVTAAVETPQTEATATVETSQKEASDTGAGLIKQQSVRTTSADDNHTSETMSEIPEEEGVTDGEYPNIICVLLESFIDPELVNFLQLSDEVVPNFHYLYNNYSSGYLEVPVVGAGTANTEFEVLTGMGMQFFGLGEYPYKTILKETNCESIASDLHTLGYGTHAVHNNGGNFYSRRNAFSMMGFDTFTSKELMDIQDYTPLGTWPTDDILVGEVEKSLDYTPNQPDFVYTITVESHGDYPKYKVLDDPEIRVSGAKDEGMNYAWEYYVNQIHQVDDFIGQLIDMLKKRDEKTIVVMFGDHLPTMGLTESDMKTGSLFKTQYVTWNNFGLKKVDKSMTAYQLLADITDEIGIHNGTMFTFHQNRYKYATEDEYQNAMELLQYDILYGDHYVYGGGNPYPASDLIMGTEDVIVKQIIDRPYADCYYISGENFTKWSKVYINDTKVSTTYLSSRLLKISREDMPEGENQVVVNQVGSSESIFRSSNTLSFERKADDADAAGNAGGAR